MKLIHLLVSFYIFLGITSAYGATDSPQQPVSTFFNFLAKKQEVNYDVLFHEVVEQVKQSYVEEVTDKKIYEAALDGMLSALDPYSSFLNEKDYQEMRISTKGEFGGLGVEVTMDKGFIKVISPYEDSPAFKAGIKIGDYITSIDGQALKNMSLSQAVEKLRGKPKTKVKLAIFREPTNESLEITITREVIKIIPVKARIIAGDIAYIKLSTFSENTASMLSKEYKRLLDSAHDNKSEIRGMILDLRWNAGGLLEQSKEVAELFLDNATIVSTKGRIAEANQTLYSEGQDITESVPMAVLINGGSASAAEIVAGALQDNKRALVVGTKSFGKGLVQSVISLPPNHNTAIKLSIARFYTPSGKAIQGNGIIPDVTVEDSSVTPVKVKEIGSGDKLDKEQNLPLTNNKKNLPAGILGKDEEDYQLIRAIDIVKGMALYSERLVN